MIQALENRAFYTPQERRSLVELKVLKSSQEEDPRESFAALMLAAVLEVAMVDGATTPPEFEAIERYIRTLERDFALSTRERMEEIGTTMGMIPFIASEWSREDFAGARKILGEALERLDEKDSERVRGAIAKAALEVASASGGFLKMATISDEEQTVLTDMLRSLKLDTTREGLKLLGTANR